MRAPAHPETVGTGGHLRPESLRGYLSRGTGGVARLLSAVSAGADELPVT